MRIIEVEPKFEEIDGIEEHVGMVTKDGTLITEFDGCDWKQNPADILVNDQAHRRSAL